MASIDVKTVSAWYEVAIRDHGRSEGLDRMTIGLLEDIASQEANYARRNERQATEAEEMIARIAGEE